MMPVKIKPDGKEKYCKTVLGVFKQTVSGGERAGLVLHLGE